MEDRKDFSYTPASDMFPVVAVPRYLAVKFKKMDRVNRNKHVKSRNTIGRRRTSVLRIYD